MAQIYMPPESPTVKILRLLQEVAETADLNGIRLHAAVTIQAGAETHVWKRGGTQQRGETHPYDLSVGNKGLTKRVC